MQKRISKRMNYPFDKYFEEQCKTCIHNRRCKKDRNAMLFCVLTNSYDGKNRIDYEKNLQKIKARFG